MAEILNFEQGKIRKYLKDFTESGILPDYLLQLRLD